ncbi:uncharacterized protein LOC120134292 [Hibiscus syriacus]|uniref:uncharacterized protein LOC120134292 n=1 Tax=Hibiscus syriacus TaxID=106335 RepID=UPI0019220696|nr:uncharacterized protein LOC120134292 [Hibiscus syriacus]
MNNNVYHWRISLKLKALLSKILFRRKERLGINFPVRGRIKANWLVLRNLRFLEMMELMFIQRKEKALINKRLSPMKRLLRRTRQLTYRENQRTQVALKLMKVLMMKPSWGGPPSFKTPIKRVLMNLRQLLKLKSFLVEVHGVKRLKGDG